METHGPPMPFGPREVCRCQGWVREDGWECEAEHSYMRMDWESTSWCLCLARRRSSFILQLLPSHVEAVLAFPHPSSRMELLRFLGLVNFYSCFMRAVAGFLLPLKGSSTVLTWTPLNQAFADAKMASAGITKLEHPQAGLLIVDASANHVGIFFSRKQCVWSWVVVGPRC